MTHDEENKARVWSPHQLAVFDNVANGQGHTVVLEIDNAKKRRSGFCTVCNLAASYPHLVDAKEAVPFPLIYWECGQLQKTAISNQAVVCPTHTLVHHAVESNGVWTVSAGKWEADA